MRKAAFFLLTTFFAAGPALAQVDCNLGIEPIDRKAESRMSPTDFIRDVTRNEAIFAKAFSGFAYKLEVDLKTLDDDKVDGEFHEITSITYDANGGGRRIVKVGDTVDTLSRVSLANRDIDALRDAFSITQGVLADRDVVYSGRQKIDDFNASVFDILPRDSAGQPSSKTFTGRVWVRVRDSAIVRSCGRVAGGPFGPMRYLVQRAKVADKYWFPSTINADENVRGNGGDVHVRVDVKYTDYVAR
ncbi:MAG TPA: hypothetical protein VFB13_13740 [Reyranella sp.]|jgi:hypothetical protein|nr:hypothetical protein [Reyranella sp.]